MTTATERFWRDPALPFAEARTACASRACYRSHAHDTASVGAVDAGRSVFRCQGRATPIAPGSVVRVPPGVVHDCNPEKGAWSYRMLHLDVPWVHGVLAEIAPAAGAASPLLHEPLATTAATAWQGFAALCRQLFSDAPAAAKEAHLVAYVGREADGLASQRLPHPRRVRAGVARAHALLRLHWAEPLPVAELARAARMGRYAFIRAFHCATGLPPHAWQLDLRIQQARVLLRQGAGLADVALATGFADQSHFQRAFKARVAMTPGRYRAAG
ncbi:AraC family transcriptional regulator [Xylophilus sp.]|uniref:AraC family transcriptional regulator n=1 Tax=Xylophilus sp. TaxID=2653893 RepID=UPI0013B6DDA8|nr:AraC family transcriptional regulator [Xylophilus sp.]KAF1047088.1 MAG: Exoenzyme S synthesis regulatory protein ExsA [Xylophilus sp.]